MTLEYKYLDGFITTYNSNLNICTFRIKGNRIFEKSKTGMFSSYSFNFIEIDDRYLKISCINSSDRYLDGNTNKSVSDMINKLKSYYLYNRRKDIIESI